MIVTRAEWGARDPRSRPAFPGQSKGLGVHYNGPALGLVGGCRDGRDCADAVRGTQAFHMDTRGWADIAYNWLVCASCGRVYEGRGWDVRSAANGTRRGNDRFHAVMILIGQGEPITDEAKAAVIAVQRRHRRRYGTHRLRAHGSFKPTRCPGTATKRWLRRGAPKPLQPDDQKEATDVWTPVKARDRSEIWAVGPTVFHVSGPSQYRELLDTGLLTRPRPTELSGATLTRLVGKE